MLDTGCWISRFGRGCLYSGSLFVCLLAAGCIDDRQEDLEPLREQVARDAEGGLDQPALQVDLDPSASDYGVFFIRNLDTETISTFSSLQPSDLADMFAIYQHDLWLEDPSLPSMMGEYDVGPSFVSFRPRFPLVAGLSYRVHFSAALSDTLITVPQIEFAERVSVVQVYPTSVTLPDNLLKFYIHFSGPMSRGVAFDQLALYDLTDDKEVEAPFVEMTPELWDPDQQRFTLLFDPGRIKRLVGNNIEAGPPLQPGHRYELRIQSQWPDVHGNTLLGSFNKTFDVAASDRLQPSAASIEVVEPDNASAALTLVFPEPMDHGLLHRFIQVLDAQVQPVSGSIEITDQEQRWAFTPETPWEAGRYEIRINAFLEDVAGNTFNSLFDVDLRDAPTSEVRESERFRSLFFNTHFLSY